MSTTTKIAHMTMTSTRKQIEYPTNMFALLRLDSPPPKLSPTEFPQFLSLPSEIRQLIYIQAMLAEHQLNRAFGHKHDNLHISNLPSVCRTSRKESSIASHIFLQSLRLRFCADTSIISFRKFLSSLPDPAAAFGAIKHITFDHTARCCTTQDVHGHVPSGPFEKKMFKDMSIMLQCPNLSSITFILPDHGVTSLSTAPRKVPTPNDVVYHYMFQWLIERPSLIRVTFEVADTQAKTGVLAMEIMAQVATWAKRMFFCTNGKSLETEVKRTGDEAYTVGLLMHETGQESETAAKQWVWQRIVRGMRDTRWKKGDWGGAAECAADGVEAGDWVRGCVEDMAGTRVPKGGVGRG